MGIYMRFKCTGCGSRYTVADERIPLGKVLRIACKRCKQTMRISRTGGLEGVDMLPPRKGDAPSAASPARRVRWFLLLGQDKQGPFTEQEVLSRLDAGDVDRNTYAWCKGMGHWQRLGKSDFFITRAEPAPAEEAEPAPAAVAEPLPEIIPPSIAPSLAMSLEGASTADSGDAVLMAGLIGTPTGDGIARNLDSIDNKQVGHRRDGARPPPADLSAQALAREEAGVMVREGRSPFSTPTTDEQEPIDISADTADDLDTLAKFSDQLGKDECYLRAPPGEETRIFMAEGGIFKRRQQHKVWAILIGILVLVLGGVIVTDITGVIELPGMGAVYDMAGWQDPNKERAVTRISIKLNQRDITTDERKQLRAKLANYGFGDPGKVRRGPRKHARKKSGGLRGGPGKQYFKAFKDKPPSSQGGITAKPGQDKTQDLLAAMYADNRKKEIKVDWKSVTRNVSVSDLPEGLTREAITKVIGDSVRSLKLCVAEAARAGEKVDGRMEVEFTIHGSGKVTKVIVPMRAFKGTRMASCVQRTMRRWAFPRFNGEPVTVAYPIILSLGI